MSEIRAKDSKPIIELLKREFETKFKVIIESQNKFPIDQGATYNPDLVLRGKKDNSIKAIIEVEQGSRKHVVGGVITADYCMGKQDENPIMFIVALNESRKDNYRKRLPMLNSYKRYLKEVIIDCQEGVIKKLKVL